MLGVQKMKLFFYIFGTLAVLLISGSLLIQNPDVQDKLVQREITKRMSSTPDHLFADDALRVTLCGSAAPMPIRERAAA
jgi:hypothetical protein